MEISVENSYGKYHLMQNLLDNLQKGVKYSAQVAIYQAECKIEEKFIDQKLLSISDLQMDYLNLDNSVRNNEKSKS